MGIRVHPVKDVDGYPFFCYLFFLFGRIWDSKDKCRCPWDICLQQYPSIAARCSLPILSQN